MNVDQGSNDDDNNIGSSNNNIGNIIVRVKRRRDQEPVDHLCIVEEITLPERKKVRDLIDSFSTLNQNNESQAESSNDLRNGQGLVLSRIQTFNHSNDVDSQTLITATTINSNKRERNDIGVYDDNIKDSHHKPAMIANHTWITQGKKCLRLNEKGSFVVVDLNQEMVNDTSNKSDTNTVDGQSSVVEDSKKRVPILDPPTRRLDLAIEKARVSGDFTDMNSALLLGASINYQRYENKQTCLMIAAMHVNVRMVAKLLMKDVDIFAEDFKGRVAYDYIERNCSSSKRGATLEVITMLQNAKMKAFQLGNRQNQKDRQNSSYTKHHNSVSNNNDYVFDIFMLNSTNDNSTKENTVVSKENEQSKCPTIKIEGLHILNDGRCELVHTYDSDWSDLADDEDIDSNDERYEGNDYPEEEDYSDNNSNDIEEARHAGFNNNDNDYDLEDYDDDDDKYNQKNQHNSIGRVMHYYTPDDPFANLNRDQAALQELWGEDIDDVENEFNEEIDYEDTAVGALKEHRERVLAMRTGSTFASDPREFNERGLPKYGQDISDDEIDEKLLREAFEETEEYYQKDNKNRFITARPPKNSVAFDPDMDLSD